MRRPDQANRANRIPGWLRAAFALILPIVLCCQVDAVNAQNVSGTFREAVSVDVETQVVKTLETAREHIIEGQWEPAVAILQELINSSGDTLIPVEPGRYSNTGDYCHLLISQFPTAGLTAYRNRGDAQAKEWVEAGRQSFDESLLLRVVDSAFNSTYGDDALWLLGEVAFERGRYALARQYWSLLVPSSAPQNVGAAGQDASETAALKQTGYLTYPDPSVSREEVLARLVLCSIFEGDRARAFSELVVCRTQFPDASGTIAGRTGKLVDILSDTLMGSDTWPRGEPVSDVSLVPGGSLNRSDLLKPNAKTDRLVWRRSLPRNRFTGPMSRAAMEMESPPPFFPLVSGDSVYISGPESVFAFDAATGRPKWPIGNNDEGRIYTNILERPVMPHLPSAGLAWYTLCVSDGRLYARMGPPVMRRSRNEGNTFSEIVGLDIAEREGELVFHVTSDVLDPEAESPEATSWSFEGSPLVSNGRVYVSARRGFPEDETLVACFDADSSRLLWRRRVCASLKSSSDRFNLIGQNLLTLGDGRLFLTTGTGAIAALDAEDGRLVWVVTYQSGSDETAHELSDPRRHGLAPCVFHRGVVYAAPDDANLLLALDATTGQPVWRQRFADRVLQIIGVVDRRLILCGQSVWAVDTGTGQPAWPEKIGFADPAGRGYGRPALSQDFLYWPTRDEILRIDHRSGRIAGRILLREDFGLSGGNLVIANERLLIAQTDGLVALGAVDDSLLKPQPVNKPKQPSDSQPGTAGRSAPPSVIRNVSLQRAVTEQPSARTAASGLTESSIDRQEAGSVEKSLLNDQLWPVRRVWQVTVPDHSTVWFPEVSRNSPSVGPVVTNQATLQLLDPKDGREGWSVSVSEPFDHVVASGSTLVFAGSTAVTSRSLHDGRLLWRRQFQARESGRVEIRTGFRDDQILLVRSSTLVALDSSSGDEIWRWPASERAGSVAHPAAERFPAEWTISRSRILFRPVGSATHVLIDAGNGHLLSRGTLPFAVSALIEVPNTGAPSRTAIVGTDSEQKIRLTQLAELGVQWEHIVSASTHGKPETLSDGSLIVIIEDRQFVVRLDVETGRQLWRRPISAIPIADMPNSVVLNSTDLFTVSDGVVRSFDVEDVSLKWQRYLDPEPWRIQLTNDALICINDSMPEGNHGPKAGRASIAILDAASGKMLQRLHFQAAVSDISVHSDRCFVRSGDKLFGFEVWPWSAQP